MVGLAPVRYAIRCIRWPAHSLAWLQALSHSIYRRDMIYVHPSPVYTLTAQLTSTLYPVLSGLVLGNAVILLGIASARGNCKGYICVENSRKLGWF